MGNALRSHAPKYPLADRKPNAAGKTDMLIRGRTSRAYFPRKCRSLRPRAGIGSGSTRELVLGPEKPGEIRDSKLVISNPDHEMKNAKIPSNSTRPHEFTSLRPLPESVSMFRGKTTPGKGGGDAP